ncbi:putative RNA-directed DNA polymerase [Tanacetum coccineum]
MDWDAKAEQGELSLDDISNRDGWIWELNQLEQKERNSLKHKSRMKWEIKGDENTNFFHSQVNKKFRKQSIKGLFVNGFWTENPDSIKLAAFQHFEDRFKEPMKNCPLFHSSLLKRLEESDIELIEAAITIEEVKEVVWNCVSSKASGSDGLNFKFIKRYWELLKDDFYKCIRHFDVTCSLARGCNASFTVLAPKKKDPLVLNNYHPICLISCTYKVISKILASRLANVMHKLISLNQIAFLAGRQILDSSLIANEIVNFAKHEGARLLLFKVDFEKAFDSVNYKFLQDVMILINGSPTKEFGMKRGLRQGDPLSPFLFLIMAEALQVLTLEACSRRLYNKFSLANDGSNISLLQFENDALFFGEWSSFNAIHLVRMLKCFNDASSLKVNLSKSRIYGVGAPILEVNQAANTIKYLHGNLTFLYLGLPVGKYIRLGKSWSNMTDSFVRRLSSWKAKLLSTGRRLSLVKAVLVSLPLYFLSVFRAANQVLNKLELIRCRFFWGFKDDSLDKVAKCSKKQISRRSGYRLIPCKKFSSYGGIGVARVLRSRSSVWQNILRSIEEIKKIGVPLDSLMTQKIISAWRSPPRGRVDFDLHSLEHLLSGLSLQPEKDDAWAWNVDISGKFSVKCFSDLVQSKLLAESNLEVSFKWNSWVPKKVNICLWRASLNRLPTRSNLTNKGINLESD